MGLFHVLISLLLVICISAECKNIATAGGSPRVTLPQATVEGFRDLHNNTIFLGIPFADTTGGQNRWKAPQDVPKAAENTILNATQYGATCPQAITGTLYSQQGENCLNLNIWAPATGSDLPVFVYMYGGAMVTGSSSNPMYQGNNFARKGVIFVTFNTRESIFAYPNSAELQSATESQNFGILDVDKALDWIRENIAAFGGNPDHIVFGGHSSGSVQVDDYLWNHPDTWLVGAVQMSANVKSGPAVAPVNQALDVVAAEVGCPTGAGQLACLREVDLYEFQTEMFNATYNTWFTPAVDNVSRYQDYESRFAAGNYASHVPLLTGNSDEEGAIFALVYGGENTNFSAWLDTFDADVAWVTKDILLAAYNASDFETISQMSGAQYGDARFYCPVDYLRSLRSTAQDTWSYRFFGNYSNVLGAPIVAPSHGTEIPFFLGGNECFDAISNVTEAEQALADYQNDWFVSWIKNPSAGPGWDKVTPKSSIIANLGVPGNELAIELADTDDYNRICQSVYNPYMPKYPVIQNVAGV